MTKAGRSGSVPGNVALAIFKMISIPPRDGTYALSGLFGFMQRLTIRLTELRAVVQLLGPVFAGWDGVARAMI